MGKLAHYFESDFAWVKVYRALCDVLTEDPVLSLMSIEWDVRKGAANEGMPPSPTNLPWVAVVPLEIPLEVASEQEDKATFHVRIDFAVSGTDWSDLGNFAGAIYNALKRNKPFRGTTVDEYFRNVVDCHYWVKRAGVGARRTETPPSDTSVSPAAPVVDQFASALVKFDLYIPNLVDVSWPPPA